MAKRVKKVLTPEQIEARRKWFNEHVIVEGPHADKVRDALEKKVVDDVYTLTEDEVVK